MRNERREVQQLPKTSLGKKLRRRKSASTDEGSTITSTTEQQITDQQLLEQQAETPLPEQQRAHEHRARMAVLQRLADKEQDRLGMNEQERRYMEQQSLRPIFTEEELNIIREATPFDVIDLEFGCGPYHMDSTPHRKGLEWRIRNENPSPSRNYVFKRLIERELARYEMEGEEDIGQEEGHLREFFEQQSMQRKQEEEKRRYEMERKRKRQAELAEARRISKERQHQSSPPLVSQAITYTNKFLTIKNC
jgi:hypothetical protein